MSPCCATCPGTGSLTSDPAVAMPLRPPRVIALLAALIWCAVLWWLLVERQVTGMAIARWSYVNNLAHAGVFGLLALLVGMALDPGRIGGRRSLWLLASLLALAYSGLLEWRQGFTEGRVSDWKDMATNTVGVFGAPWGLTPWPLAWRRVAVVAGASFGCAAWATFG